MPDEINTDVLHEMQNKNHKCFFAKARPEQDFKYNSNLFALLKSENAK